MANHKEILDQANQQAGAGDDLLGHSLKELLLESAQSNKKRIPQEMLLEMEKATEALKQFNFKEHTLKVGDIFPDCALLNYKSEPLALRRILDGHKAIITFYRGSWCPYCNLELHYWDKLLAQPGNEQVLMLAISPERPDVTLANKDIENLHFQVLSDVDNTLAKKLGLVFGLPEQIQAIYVQFGIDLDATQGNTLRELPVPATFIVDAEAKVVYVDLDEDYTTRPEANEVLAKYKEV